METDGIVMEPSDSLSSVECRPSKSCRPLPILLTFMGLIVLGAAVIAPASARLLVEVYAALFLIPALLLAIWSGRAGVIADDAGLRWRGLGGWRGVAWAGVTDYYQKLPQKTTRTAWYVVETTRGHLLLREELWGDTAALRTVIARKAASARATAWGVWGTRPEQDWPRTFGYNSRDNKILAAFTGGLALLLAALVVHITHSVARTFAQMGPGWGWGTVAILLFGLCPCGLVAWLVVSQVGETRRRRAQMILVSADGITFNDGATSMATAWDEISDYGIVSSRGSAAQRLYAMMTRNGSFDFTSAIQDAEVLRRIVTDNALSAAAKAWRSADDDVLGGRARLWSSGCEGVGERVFHYRTRTNRALLFLPTVVAVFLNLMVALARAGLTANPSAGWGAGWGLPLVVLCAVLWAWWRYFSAAVQISADGIMQNTILGPHRLRWSQVERFYVSSDDFGNVTGGATRIRFWMGISQAEELKSEIARRATQSRNRVWEQTPREINRAAPRR